MSTKTAADLTGSSPRGRGKLVAHPHDLYVDRLIPARAGKTRRSDTMKPRKTAHPRAGGENAPETSNFYPFLGSSPRGRGKRTWGWRRRTERRLIPARAGKTRGP
mgnify:CR=1 FL=1